MQLPRDTRGLTQVRPDIEPRTRESLQCGFFCELGWLCYNSKFELGAKGTKLCHVSIFDYFKDPRCDADSVTLRISLTQAVGPVAALSAYPGVLAAPSTFYLIVISAFID